MPRAQVSACVCLRGHTSAGGACVPCGKGKYKGAVGNFPCTPCLPGETTIEDSATNSTGCVCESSRYLGIQ